MLLIAHSNSDILKGQCGWFRTYEDNGDARLEHATQGCAVCHDRTGTPADLRTQQKSNGQRKVRFGLCIAPGRTRSDV